MDAWSFSSNNASIREAWGRASILVPLTYWGHWFWVMTSICCCNATEWLETRRLSPSSPETTKDKNDEYNLRNALHEYHIILLLVGGFNLKLNVAFDKIL